MVRFDDWQYYVTIPKYYPVDVVFIAKGCETSSTHTQYLVEES